ncbi:MAG: hypothetical protein ABIR26_08530 [Ramlibacter sp.]
MTFDLSPLHALAPETGAQPEAGAEAFTLTLCPAKAADSESLLGRIAGLAGTPVLAAHAMRASVVPADSQALTLTL